MELDAPVNSHAPRRTRGAWLRPGRLSVPSAAVAWGVSIAAHGAVLVVALTALRREDTRPALELRLGDGGESGGGFFVAGAPEADSHALPAPPAAAAPAESFTPPAAATGEAELGTWHVASPRPELAGGRAQPGPIGIPSQVVGEIRRNRVAVGTGRGDRAGGGNGPGAGGTPGVPGGLTDGRLPAPVYPRESRLRGEQGTVVIEVDVAADGSIQALHVVENGGFPRLAEAALAAVRKARFRPVACRLRIPFNFRLRTSPS